MADYNQENFFIGGMNQDDSDELMPPTDWRYALCCMSGNNQKDAVGSIENFQGNTLISFTLPDGENRCIGRGTDGLGSIFYMVWNSNQNHCILRYEIDTNIIYRVLYPQFFPFVVNTKFLNFQNHPDNRIQTIKIISLKQGQQMAYWTDGFKNDISIPYDNTVALQLQELKPYNPPRSINLTLAENLCAGILPRYPATLGAQNNAYQNQYTDVIKYPPYKGPDVSFQNDVTKNTNYFRGKPLPQFRYRYLFVNGEPSAWSPISEVALPQDDETILGVATFNYYRNNYVQISYNTGHESAVTVELAVRFGNLGTWYVLDVIEKYNVENEDIFPQNVLIPSDTIRTYDFYNNQRLRAIATQELYNFSNVPIVSKDQEYVESNRMVYANNVSGYDPVNIDVVSSVGLRYADLNRVQLDNLPTSEVGRFSITDIAGNLLIPFNTTGVPAGTFYSFEVVIGGTVLPNIYFSGSITESQVNAGTFLSLAESLVIQINQQLAALAVPQPFAVQRTTVVVAGQQYFAIRLLVATSPLFVDFANLKVKPMLNKETSFKLGAWHKFGVVYYDDGMRSGAANTEEEINVYVPFYSESSFAGDPYTPSISKSGIVSEISISIRNLAPKWAKTYQIAYAGSNISFFVQLPIVGAPTVNAEGNSVFGVKSLLEYFVNDNKPTPINYVYQDGDRVRFITDTNGNILSQYIDVAIKELDTTAPITIVTDFVNTGGLFIGEGSLIEIYRTKPSTDQDQIVYEFSQEYDVLYDQATNLWYHESTSPLPNQDPNDPINFPGIVEMFRGDVYTRRRGYKSSAGTALFFEGAVEDFNFSDFYPSEDIDIGRTNVISDQVRQKELETGLTHSDVFFQETDINGLSTFRGDAGSVLLLSLNFGPICRIIEVGYTLKVFQQTKVSSIYIGRLSLTKADGTEDLTATDQVFGTKLIPEEETGTTWPGSVFKHDRHVYFFDGVKGEIVRDAPNGQFAISKYKMVKTFRNLGSLVSKYQRTGASSVDIVSTFDERIGCYIITILVLNDEITDLESQSIAFHEDSNRWKTYLPYTPEMHGEKGQESIISFVNGQVWVHYSETAPYNNFYGIQYRQKMRLIHNLDPNKVKVMNRIAIHSTSKWEATDENGDYNIIIPANDQYPQGMKSRLLASKFKGKESGWYSEFLRDVNTPGAGTDEQNLVNGRTLRGYILDVQIENEEIKYVRLFSVMTTSTPSELSKFAGPQPPEI